MSFIISRNNIGRCNKIVVVILKNGMILIWLDGLLLMKFCVLLGKEDNEVNNGCKGCIKM